MLCYLLLMEDEEEKRKFERIYLNYRQTMFFVANDILKDDYLAEDAVHLAFLRLVNHLDKVDEENHLRTKSFLTIIVEHIAIDIYRKRKKENNISYEEISGQILEETCDAENNNRAVEAILKLPIIYSSVLRLRYVQGYDNEEIAEMLHITGDNVRQRISRGKKLLADMLSERG